jgi:hypothetical protein
MHFKNREEGLKFKSDLARGEVWLRLTLSKNIGTEGEANLDSIRKEKKQKNLGYCTWT